MLSLKKSPLDWSLDIYGRQNWWQKAISLLLLMLKLVINLVIPFSINFHSFPSLARLRNFIFTLIVIDHADHLGVNDFLLFMRLKFATSLMTFQLIIPSCPVAIVMGTFWSQKVDLKGHLLVFLRVENYLFISA